MPENQWLVVFLVYADYRLQGFKNNQKTFRELENVLSDFRECTINEGVKLVIIFNSIRFIKEGAGAKEDMTYVFEVQPRKAASQKNSFSCIEVINNEASPAGKGKPHTVEKLETVFKLIAANPLYKAAHIMLNTWDHGSAFGIFKEGELAEAVTALTANPGTYPITEELFRLKKENTDSLYEKLQAQRSDEPVFFYKRKYFTVKDLQEHDNNKTLYNTLIASGRELYSFGDFVQIEAQDYIESYFTRDFVDTNAELFSTGKTEKLADDSTGFVTKKLIPVEFQYEILTNQELADAIKGGLGRVDVLLMMNCWMMNLDTLYTLRDRVDYLVAPPSDIDEPGYNYLEILNHFTATSTAAGIANLPLSTFRMITSPYRKMYDENLDKSCIMFEMPSAYVPVAAGINEFAELLIAEIRNNNARLLHLLLFFRKCCFKYDQGGGYHIIDFSHWLLCLTKNCDEGEDISRSVKNKIFKLNGLFSSLLNNIDAKSNCGSSFYSGLAATAKIHELPTASGIYFPSNKSQFENPENKKLIAGSAFIQEFPNWVKLIELIFSDLNFHG